VDGQAIPLTPFVCDIMKKTVKGMLTALKGCKDPQQIEIKIE
jgi:hypothetical protein